MTFLTEDTKPTMFRVDYNCSTPHGSSANFTRTVGLNQLRGNSRSETAALAYLQKLHGPGCTIQINNIEFV